MLRLFLLALLLVLPATGHAAGPPREGEMSRFSAEETPKPFPAFRFRTMEGQEKTLADFKGRLVLLNIWASWCGPCVDEMPSLDALDAGYADDRLAVVALSLDRGGARAVEAFLAKVPMKALKPYLETDYTLQKAVQLRGMPTTFLIDGEGRMLGTYLGPADWNGADARKLIDWYLSAKPAAPRAMPTGLVLPSPDSLREPVQAAAETPAAIDPMVWAMFETACGKRCRKGENEFEQPAPQRPLK